MVAGHAETRAPQKIALQVQVEISAKSAAAVRQKITDSILAGLKDSGIDWVLSEPSPGDLALLRLVVDEDRGGLRGSYGVRVAGVFLPKGPAGGGETPRVRSALGWTLYRQEPAKFHSTLAAASLSMARTLLLDDRGTRPEGDGPWWIGGFSNLPDLLRVDPALISPAKPVPLLVYPAEARRNHVEGAVVMAILTDGEGKVSEATVLEGHPALAGAALRYAIGLEFRIPVEFAGKAKIGFPLSLQYRLPDLIHASKVFLEIQEGRTVEPTLRPDLRTFESTLSAYLQKQGVTIVKGDDGDAALRHLRIQVETFKSLNGLYLFGVFGRLSMFSDRSTTLGGATANLLRGKKDPQGVQESIANTIVEVTREILAPPRMEPSKPQQGLPTQGISGEVMFDFSRIKIRHQPPAPRYPAYAKIHRVQGTVVVELIIDETGKPSMATVVEGPPELFLTALDYALEWDFEPAQLNGIPVKAKFKLTMPFRLR